MGGWGGDKGENNGQGFQIFKWKRKKFLYTSYLRVTLLFAGVKPDELEMSTFK